MSTDELSDETERAVETFVSDWVSEERIPGAAIAIFDADAVDGDDSMEASGDDSTEDDGDDNTEDGEVANDGVIYAEGFGARRLDGNEAATPDTLFGVGSCTKTVTATAVMQLVERGDLALDDPVDDYLPHLADAPGDPITIAELLSHTSGMPSDGSAEPLIVRAIDGASMEVPLSSAADFRRHVQGAADRRVTDRETFFYYNSGYTMLGLVVEDVTGDAFTDYVAANVLDPLGMTRATFDRETFEDDDDRMTPYLKEDDASAEKGFPFDSLIPAPGGLLCSVRELAGLLRLLAGEGTVRGDEGETRTVLDVASVDAMATPIGSFGTYFDGRDVGYGLMIEEYLGDRLVGHGGSVAVSNAWYGFLEDAGIGVTIACTTDPETHPAEVGMAVLAILEDEDPELVQPHYHLVSTLDAAAGEYADYRDVTTATVERVGGSLRLQFDDGEMELLLATERIDDDADLLVCETTDAFGMTRDVRFEFGDDQTDLFYERKRLTRQT